MCCNCEIESFWLQIKNIGSSNTKNGKFTLSSYWAPKLWQNTKFDSRYLSGPVNTSEINAFSTTVSTSENCLLHNQIKRFWELEEVEKDILITEADSFCENFYQKSTARETDGRYVVRLPFKKQFPTDIFLGSSRNSALGQYCRIEKTLELKEYYRKVLQEYIHLDHVYFLRKTIFLFFTTPCGYSTVK